jgi:predicted nucleic acid binding AN1-type Zn finger protein
MQVGSEFDDIGGHCEHEGCNRHDFLPFTCDACDKKHCLEHHTYDGHDCAEGRKRNVVVPRCPDCDQTLYAFINEMAPASSSTYKPLIQSKLFSLGHGALDWGQAEDPDFVKSHFTPERLQMAIDKHRADGCGSKKGNTERKLKARCRFGGCKKKEYLLDQCRSCSEKFCMSHRHKQDHCCGQAARLRPRTKRARAAASSAPLVTIPDPTPHAHNTQPAAPEDPPVSDEDLARLCEMGFSVAEATRALAGASNRMEDAVRRLVAIGA